MKVKYDTAYSLIILLAFFIYGSFSSSTPDNPGIVELIIGVLLVFLVGIKRWYWILSFNTYTKSIGDGIKVPKYVVASFIYLLIVPTINGLMISGNAISDYVRDIIPLLYFFLPVLILHRMDQGAQRFFFVILIGLCFVGVMFSIRHFTESGSLITEVGQKLILGNQSYFPQDPAVQFAGAFLLCFGVVSVLKGDIVLGVLLLALSFFPWAAMFGIIARAPTGLTVLSLSLVLIVFLIFKQIRIKSIFIALLLTSFLLIIYLDQIIVFLKAILALLSEKQQNHGLNARDLEILAVINNVDGVRVLLFGEGWGGLLANPTGWGMKFRFVHNMFGYFLFKTGLFGLIALFLYMGWYIKMIFEILSRRIDLLILVTIISFFVPLLINILLEAGYKSLSFGFLLLLIPILWQTSMQRKVKILSTQ